MIRRLCWVRSNGLYGHYGQDEQISTTGTSQFPGNMATTATPGGSGRRLSPEPSLYLGGGGDKSTIREVCDHPEGLGSGRSGICGIVLMNW